MTTETQRSPKRSSEETSSFILNSVFSVPLWLVCVFQHADQKRFHQRRSGFTLLELLLAAGLSAMVMAASLQALLIVSRTQQAGRDAIVSAQIGRNLMRQLEWDLSHLVPLAAEEATSDEMALVDDLQTINDDPTDVISLTDGEVLTTLAEMVGTLDRLELRIDAVMTEAQWKRTLASSADPTASEVVTGMERARRVVIWNPLGDGSGIVAVDSAHLDQKVLRQELAVDTTETVTGEVRVTPVPEVTSITFRYYDGLEWLEAWDSTVMGAYPKCIEMRLELGAKNAGSDEAVVLGTGKVLTRVLTLDVSRFETTSETATGLEEEL